MQRRRPGIWACALLAAALACSKQSDCLLVVTVKASSRLTGIRQLNVTLHEANDGGAVAADTLSFKAPGEGWIISSAMGEIQTLGIEVRPEAGKVTLELEALDDAGRAR